jgi:hypothetical protein
MTLRTPFARRRPAPPGTPTGPPETPDQAHDQAHDLEPLGGPEGNARLTGMTAAVLLVLLAAEGATLLQLHSLITPHVVIGMVLVPFVVVKLSTTGWRMAKYYLGAAPYRERGAPPMLLRLLGPVVVAVTVAVFASGIALLLVPHSMRQTMFFLHKVTFILWFGAMTVHVLGHVVDTSRLAPADFVARTRRQVRGAGVRMWTLAATLVVGVVLAALMAPTIGPWLAAGGSGG